MKYPQEYDDGGMISLDVINKKELNDPRVQAMFEGSRHINISIFIISQDYYDLPKRSVSAIMSIIYFNHTLSETFKIPIRKKQAWT